MYYSSMGQDEAVFELFDRLICGLDRVGGDTLEELLDIIEYPSPDLCAELSELNVFCAGNFWDEQAESRKTEGQLLEAFHVYMDAAIDLLRDLREEQEEWEPADKERLIRYIFSALYTGLMFFNPLRVTDLKEVDENQQKIANLFEYDLAQVPNILCSVAAAPTQLNYETLARDAYIIMMRTAVDSTAALVRKHYRLGLGGPESLEELTIAFEKWFNLSWGILRLIIEESLKDLDGNPIDSEKPEDEKS